jgi:glutamate synthase (NADPH/NADH) small chain
MTLRFQSTTVAVVGGGNVAMDAGALRKADGGRHGLYCLSQSEEELPAEKEEVHHAKEEGIYLQTSEQPG